MNTDSRQHQPRVAGAATIASMPAPLSFLGRAGGRLMALLPLVFLFGFSASGQYRHEFSAVGRVGYHQLGYSTPFGSSLGGLGLGGGLGYHYFFNSHISLGTGLELQRYQGQLDIASLQSSQQGLVDEYGHRFHFHSTLTGYSEQQQATMLHLPLVLGYQTGGHTRFYAQGGARLAVPLGGSYSGRVEGYANSAEYPDQGVTLYEPTFRGLGNFAARQHSGSLGCKASISALAEAGVKWTLPGNWLLYTGAYLEYGLGNIQGSAGQHSLVTYNEGQPEAFGTQSVLQSTHSYQGEVQPLVERASLLAVGVSVRLALGRGSTQPKAASEPVSASPAPVAAQEIPLAQPQGQPTPEQQAKERELEQERARELQQEQDRREQEQREQEEYQQAQERVQRTIDGYNRGGIALSAEKKKELDEKMVLLRTYPQLRIICQGHTCDLGAYEVNQRIGLRRAQAARAYLVQQGIAPGRIEVKSLADTQPLVPNTSEENRRQNRRVEFEIVE